jgi:hypothetical protein
MIQIGFIYLCHACIRVNSFITKLPFDVVIQHSADAVGSSLYITSCLKETPIQSLLILSISIVTSTAVYITSSTGTLRQLDHHHWIPG